MRFLSSCICVSWTLHYSYPLLASSLHLGSLGFRVDVGCGYITLRLIIEQSQMKPIVTTTRRALLLISDNQFLDNRFTIPSSSNISILVAMLRYRLPIIFDHWLVGDCQICLAVTADDLRFNRGTYPIVLLHLVGDSSNYLFLVCF